jgi:hypothetical protein
MIDNTDLSDATKLPVCVLGMDRELNRAEEMSAIRPLR